MIAVISARKIWLPKIKAMNFPNKVHQELLFSNKLVLSVAGLLNAIITQAN